MNEKSDDRLTHAVKGVRDRTEVNMKVQVEPMPSPRTVVPKTTLGDL